ncbi:hypothetical protein [Vibrio hepatarius]|jgi:hypothetical protein|uniref:hypothetical protein n=1 Tax=Vibrio hepatarius TaxID=171383 RepID=UPI002FD8BD8E
MSLMSTLKTKAVCLFSGAILCFSGSVMAENNNFRIALPENYAAKSYAPNEDMSGGNVFFSESGDNTTGERILHLQTFLPQYLSSKLISLSKKDPKAFSEQMISSELEKECVNYEVNLGRVRSHNNGVIINWWSACESKEPSKHNSYERGRVYSANFGTYIYSHYESGKGKDFKFSVKDVKWFDRYLNNSDFCESGKNCGLEGKLVDKIFVLN